MKNGVKPLAQRLNLTFRGSTAKFGYFWSKCFQANPSDGCRRTPDSWRCSWCHLIWTTVLLKHTVVAILELKVGSAFLHMKHPYDLVGWISLVIVLHVHKHCMQTNYQPVYNKGCKHSDNNQFPEHPYLNLLFFWAADDNFWNATFRRAYIFHQVNNFVEACCAPI